MSDTTYNPLIIARRSYSRKARAKRAELFRAKFPHLSTQKVLDLGGGKGDHIAKVLPDYKNVTVADFNKEHLNIARECYGYDSLQLDGSERLPLEDQQYDLIYCNSVIEHVTGPKNMVVKIKNKRTFEDLAWKHQEQFASEIRRIGRGYFVQTPYKWFWIESHTIHPFLCSFFPDGYN